MSFIAPLGDGVRRVARAPMVLAGAAVLTAAVALPPGLLLGDRPSAALPDDPAAIGDRPSAALPDDPAAAGDPSGAGREAAAGHPAARAPSRAEAAGCVPLHWWRFSQAVYPVDGRPCRAGTAVTNAPVADLRVLLAATGPDASLAAVVVVYLAVWTLFSAGAIDRYARNRPTRGAGFFAACGVYGPRLLRLALIAGVAYWALFQTVHPWAVGASPPGDMTAAGLLRHVGFGLLLALVGLVFDYARVRAVVEDRRSMIGALLAGWRFVRRHPTPCLGLYAANGLVLASVVGVYAAAAPGGSTVTPTWWGILAGQVYVVAHLAGRLLFCATEVSLFQSRLAHAGYVAAPAPVWPESASVEALGRLSG